MFAIQFDCFLSYRVASDQPTCETLFLFLKEKGLKVFMDKYELVHGAPWEEGFMKGLCGSRTCVFLASEAGLQCLKSPYRDHGWDNVLKEVETCLRFEQIMQEHWDSGYTFVFPVGVSTEANVPWQRIMSGFSKTMSPTGYHKTMRPLVLHVNTALTFAYARPVATAGLITGLWLALAIICSIRTETDGADQNLVAVGVFWSLFAVFLLCVVPITACVKFACCQGGSRRKLVLPAT